MVMVSDEHLLDVVERSSNIPDASFILGMSEGGIKARIISLGYKDVNTIVNCGNGPDFEDGRFRIDGFEKLTDWQRYQYTIDCQRNEIKTSKKKDPKLVSMPFDVWKASINLKGS